MQGRCPLAFASDLLVATSRDDGERPDARVLTDGKSALVRGLHLTAVATNIEPELCRSHNPRWSRLPHCRLPLRQELHKLGTPADSLLVRTTTSRVSADARLLHRSGDPQGDEARRRCRVGRGAARRGEAAAADVDGVMFAQACVAPP